MKNLTVKVYQDSPEYLRLNFYAEHEGKVGINFQACRHPAHAGFPVKLAGCPHDPVFQKLSDHLGNGRPVEIEILGNGNAAFPAVLSNFLQYAR
jgi:hypothetical protein